MVRLTNVAAVCPHDRGYFERRWRGGDLVFWYSHEAMAARELSDLTESMSRTDRARRAGDGVRTTRSGYGVL